MTNSPSQSSNSPEANSPEANSPEANSQPTHSRPPRTAAEWITFGIASALLTTLAGLVVYSWATERNSPPVLLLNQTGDVRSTDGQFYVPFEVMNTGGETVESVQVVAELQVGDRVEEAGEQQIDFLAGGEKESGAFVFRRDPRQGRLRLRVGSYKLP